MFRGFEPYSLTGIEVTDQELGHGSYATVLKLDYMGLNCAGKKIHETLLRQGSNSYTLRRFEEECHLLSRVRHPNIVQFLGVHFQQGLQAPILVMEFLPMNLTVCIEKYGVLAQEISYSILHDVALGLRYLHNHSPSIVHRDLSSNNVLLTSNMKAKISDLGVARIINLTPMQVSRLTQTPGTPTYMPPEVMVANPKYDKSVDTFSYGVLMIHTFSGRWPEPQVGPTQVVAGTLVPISEAERRKVFLQAIGSDHLAMSLILRCVNNDPDLRPDISDVAQELAEMQLQFPVSFSHTLDLLKCVKNVKDEVKSLKKELRLKDERIQQDYDQILGLKQEVQTKEVQKTKEIERLKLVHSTEVEQLQIQLRELVVENNLLKSLRSSIQSELEDKNKIISVKDGIITRKESEIEAMATAMKEKETISLEICGQLANVRDYLATEKQALRTTINWNQCADLPTNLAEGQSVLINNKIYCGGTGNSTDENTVCCYDTSKDKWSTLPPLSVRYFGLGHVSGELVAIGGVKKSADLPTNDIYIYDAGIQRWKQKMTPMPTSRAFPGVLSLRSVLVVAGGLVDMYDDEYTSVVEIYKTDISQWYKAASLPRVCHHISMTTFESLCYFLADCKDTDDNSNGAYYASTDDLICKSIPANSVEASNIQSPWKVLPNTPGYQPTAAMIDGHVLAIGGWDTPKAIARKKEIYMYCLSMNSWIYISDLPAPRTSTSAVTLSKTEFVVIGGYDGDDNRVSTVYKGTLTLKTR